MGKPSAPAAPDYTPIAQSDAQIAQQQFQLGTQQLDWAKQQFNTVWPDAQNYMTAQTGAMNAEQKAASDAQATYDSTYKPIEQSFASTATGYNSPARADQNAGTAMTDVANSYETNRNSALSSLESYGIDPSQTRFGALDLGTRLSQAAATAAAGTQSRLNTEATGLALQGEAINVGRGYPSAIAQSYNTATNAGASGINTANNTIGTGSSAMTGANSFINSGLNANSGSVQALNTGFNNSLAGANFDASMAANASSGIGSLVGAAGAAAALMHL